MLVVSDSSPLNFLIRLRLAGVLPDLFGTVFIPPQVLEELTRPTTPTEVRDFLTSIPAWLRIQAPASSRHIHRLDPGEDAAISLAIELKADLVLLDDGPARKVATARGLAVIGLLGILARAHERRLLDFSEVVAELPSDYRIDPRMVSALLARYRGSP